MICFDESMVPCPPASVAVEEIDNGRSRINRFATDILRKTLDEVKIGDARYRFRQAITLTFYPYISNGEGELIPEPSQIDLDGFVLTSRGKSLSEAIENWKAEFHTHVQSLLDKRPWEMSENETKDMASIERMIDLPAYLREAPYSIRQIGTVTRRRPIPDRIRWEDGQTEHVNLHQMPAEFAAFRNGQRFEAITVRDSTNGRLRRVVYVGRLDRLNDPVANRWEKTQTFGSIPEGNWNEID
jgi:hypothetical protein